MPYERARGATSAIPLSERELRWAQREAAPPALPFEERLERSGFIACPGAFGHGCLAFIPVGSGRLLCRFCQEDVRRLTRPLDPQESREARGKRREVPGVVP